MANSHPPLNVKTGRVRNSATERMSRAEILDSGTGESLGVAGVKTGKLYVEQDQIAGKVLFAPLNPRVDRLSAQVIAGLEK